VRVRHVAITHPTETFGSGLHRTAWDQGTGVAGPLVRYQPTSFARFIGVERRHPFGHRESFRPRQTPSHCALGLSVLAEPATTKGIARMDQLLIERKVERRRKRRRGIIALLAALSALTIGAGSVSLALFTDTDSSTWSFTTGSIDIESNPAVLTAITDMMPGDVAADSLTITNAGTADLRYAMTTTATNALGDELDVEVRGEDVDGACDDFDGAVVVAAGTPLDGAGFGSSVQGAQAGDRVLVGGASEVLCFQVSLPLTTLDAFQGVTSDATFNFLAEQTANNP